MFLAFVTNYVNNKRLNQLHKHIKINTIICEIKNQDPFKIKKNCKIIKDIKKTYIMDERYDFLGYNLDNALGNIDDDSFDDICEIHLKEKDNIPFDELVEKIKELYIIYSINIDPFWVHLYLNCELDEVQKAINIVLQNMEVKNERIY